MFKWFSKMRNRITPFHICHDGSWYDGVTPLDRRKHPVGGRLIPGQLKTVPEEYWCLSFKEARRLDEKRKAAGNN